MKNGRAGAWRGREAFENFVNSASAVYAHDTSTIASRQAENGIEDPILDRAMLAIPGAAIEANLADIS